MSQEGLYKPSPLIERILSQKFPKLDSEALQNIVSTARQMTKLIQPSGASQNLKAEFQDPEKALEYSRRKNMIFDSFLNHELSKLNCSKSPIKPSVKKRKRFIKPDIPSKVKIKISPQPVQALMKSFDSPLASRINFSTLDTFSRSVNYSEKFVLPPLIKSVPLHLDPAFTFPKKNVEEFEENLRKTKHIRMSSLDSVIRQSEDFIQDCKSEIQDLKQVQTIKQIEKRRIHNYMEDFSDSLRISKDQKTFEDSLSTKIYNRKLNDNFSEELDTLRSNLLEVTQKAIELGGKKIWRWNNTLFMATTDKLINSVPSMRK